MPLKVFAGVKEAIFGGQLPMAIDRLLGTIGASFSSTSLFALGMALAAPTEQARQPLSAGRAWATVLSFTVLKIILLPVIASRLEASIESPGRDGRQGQQLTPSKFASQLAVAAVAPPRP